jgi:hypothetical protein
MNLSRYYALLNAAHCASEETDLFDLDTSSPDSVTRFADLQNEDREAQAKLTLYVISNGDELSRQLANSDKD